MRTHFFDVPTGWSEVLALCKYPFVWNLQDVEAAALPLERSPPRRKDKSRDNLVAFEQEAGQGDHSASEQRKEKRERRRQQQRTAEHAPSSSGPSGLPGTSTSAQAGRRGADEETMVSDAHACMISGKS